MPELLYEQEGGEMKPSKDSGGGPKIGTTTIDMKIQLVDDKTTLPSYLIPDLTCDVGSTPISASKVKVTLTGDSLRKETPDPKDFKCEITSNFLTDKERSAITIETYYVDDKNSLLGINKIYFDESLLSHYNDKKELKKSDNPFLANATTTDNGVTYTFNFDFNDIINAIKKLPSYGQIQDMFMFVNNIDSKKIPSTITQTALINISADAFLNLKFSGVPFNSPITTDSKLKLDIATTNNPVPDGCNLKNLFGGDILTKHLHNVLELSDYKDFDFTKIAKKPVSQPVSQQVTPPVVDAAAAAAAKAAADLATAEAEHKVATAAAEVAATKATETKTNAKPVIDNAVGEIKTKMGSMLPDDKAKIPPAVKTFIDASQALATAKAGTDADATAKAEAALKKASAASGLKEAIDAGLATGSLLPDSVKAVLTDTKTIQDAHVKMDAADAEVVKSKAVMDATREKAAKAWDADQAATNAAAMLNTRTGTEAAAGSAIKVVNTNNTKAASTTSTELENKLKESIAAQSKKLDDVIAQLEALQKSQTNTGSTSVAGFGNVIVRAPGDSDACGNGGISMESRDGSLIFKVPYDKIISEIAPNMRSAMAQRALAKKAAGPNAANSDAANSDAAILVSVDPNAALAAVTGNATKPVSAPEGALVVVDQSTKDELQKARSDLAAAQLKFDPAKTKLAGITSKPVVDSSAVDTALAGANSAITAADSAVQMVTTPQTLATAKQKVTEATTAVLAVTNAVKDFSAKVDAAAPVVPKVVAAAALDPTETAPLQTAKDGLAAQQKRLTGASITSEPDELNKLKTAIGEAEQAVTAFDALTSAANDAAKVAALNGAKTKIGLLAGLLATATTAVDTAISTKPVDDTAAQIKALTEKLQKEATDVLAAAKGAYGAIISPPTPPITFTNEDGLIATATAAIAAATNADAAGKAAAIATATSAVEAAIAAAKAADASVKAAVAATGSGKTHYKTFAEYTKLYDEYDAQKKLLEEKINEFNSLNLSYISGQAGGGKPLTYSQSGGEVPVTFSNDVKIMSTTIQELFKNIFTTKDYQSKNPFYYRVNFDASSGNEYSTNQSAKKTELPDAKSSEKDFVLWCARSNDGANPQYAAVNIQSYDEFEKGYSHYLEKISIQPYNVNLSFYDGNKKKLIDGSTTDADDKTFFSDTFLKLVYYLSLMCSSRSKEIVMKDTKLYDTGDLTSIGALSSLTGIRATCRDNPYTKFVNDYLVVSKTDTSLPEISLKGDDTDKPAMVDIIATQSQNIISASLIPNPLPKIGKDKPEEPEELSTSLSEAVIAAFTDGKTAVTKTQAFIDQQNSSLTGNIIYPLRTKITTEADYTASSVEETKKDISSLEYLIQAYKHTIDIIEKCIAKIKELNPVAEKEKVTMDTYNNFYTEFKKCLVVDQGDSKDEGEAGKVRIKVVSSNFVTTLSDCFQNNEYKDTDVKPFFNAVLAASLNSNAYKIGPSKFNSYNETNDGGKINHELLLVIINSLATNEVNSSTDVNKTSFAELIKSLTDMLGDNDRTLMKHIKQKYSPEEEESSSFSLFDGGSKPNPKSKSSSSKHKSAPKSKSKTKKNHHSKSKSNKSKTPKIIMNE